MGMLKRHSQNRVQSEMEAATGLDPISPVTGAYQPGLSPTYLKHPFVRFQICISRPSGKGTTYFQVGVQPIQDPSIVADRDEYASCTRI